MELSGVFTGTLAFTLGLGFWPGFVAIVIGVVLGAVPVGLLATLGPKTGMGSRRRRLPFGKSVALPVAAQWLSALAPDGLVGLFGAQGVQLLFHVPFAGGVLIVLASKGWSDSWATRFKASIARDSLLMECRRSGAG